MYPSLRVQTVYYRRMDGDVAAIGLRIREAREGKGWSREVLAGRLNVSTETIKKMETGDRVKSWPVIKRLADALDVTPNYFFAMADRGTLTADKLAAALEPILVPKGINRSDVPSIARIVIEAVEVAQSDTESDPSPAHYRLAARILNDKSLAGKH